MKESKHDLHLKNDKFMPAANTIWLMMTTPPDMLDKVSKKGSNWK